MEPGANAWQELVYALSDYCTNQLRTRKVIMVHEIGTVALIVSAGRGHRIGGETPKQYLSVHGKSVLFQSISAFLGSKAVTAIKVVIHPDDKELYYNSVNGLDLLPPVFGGAERQDSVRLGLESLVDLKPSRVFIHDGARPLVSTRLIQTVLAGVSANQGCVPGLAMSDTVKSVNQHGLVTGTLNRQEIWTVQTPQAFRFEEILGAHRAAEGLALTDDAAVAEAAGISVKIVPGEIQNFKVTHPEDLEKLESIGMSGIRVGSGFDVHRFGAGEFVTICGVQIPFNRSLVGHSDADVGYHALTDALLGAAGKDDIGTYFPPSDDQWKDAPSDIFLKHAGELVSSLGGKIENVDLTIICEAPRIGPHREEMRGNISACLAVEPSQVNIKGKTTEKLGFLGREEGIAAQATATINLSN